MTSMPAPDSHYEVEIGAPRKKLIMQLDTVLDHSTAEMSFKYRGNSTNPMFKRTLTVDELQEMATILVDAAQYIIDNADEEEI